jgi:hypothetical protein
MGFRGEYAGSQITLALAQLSRVQVRECVSVQGVE